MVNIPRGFYTLTYRFRILDGDEQVFEKTKELYNQLAEFFLELYFSNSFLSRVSAGQLLREMEKLVIPARGCESAPVEFPFGKVPLYFRRAAINGAIAAARQMESRKEKWNGQSLHMAPVFYRGMYRELSDERVELKLWDGAKWRWYPLKLRGRQWPSEGRQMSPTLVLDTMNRSPMLHVPVQLENDDARTIREKIKQQEQICGICFTNEDAFAVCGIVRKDGSFGKARFCRGGKEYRHRCEQTLKKINASRKAVGSYGKSRDPQLNKRYWKYLKHLGEHFAHQTAREIVDFCKENGFGVLALPDYEERYGSMVLNRVGKWTPLYLSIRIRKILEYKAWSEGISIAKVRYYRRENAGEKNGGNRYLETARRIGLQCWKNHGVAMADKREDRGNPAGENDCDKRQAGMRTCQT